jgi:hypothetical protein
MATIDATYIPNIFGRTSFPLRHNGSPIFYKFFNGSDSEIVDIDNDTIRVENHFFKTGEKLYYKLVGAGTSSIGISTLSPGASGIATCFPDIVYPIVVDKDTIRVALASSLALSNSYVNITSVGIGTNHYFEAEKQNTKCLISIDNVIQSPVSVASSVGIQTVFLNFAGKLRVDSLINIKPGTILKIDDTLSRVSAVDYDLKTTPVGYGTGYDISIFNSESFLGTASTSIVGVKTAYVMEGNYNIVKDKIYFTSAPLEGTTYEITVSPQDINYGSSGISSYSFNYFTNNFITGSQVSVYGAVPPGGLISGNNYFIIKNSENNFSFAQSYLNAINKQKIELIDSVDIENPVTNLQLIQIIPNNNTSFHGRVFLRSNYSGNAVFDDISEGFNGISTSFPLKISGINTVGIKSDNGIVLINNIFQYPEFEEAFIFQEDSISGITSISFIGSNGQYSPSGFGTTKNYDVNVGGLPRGGIIVGYGLSGGQNLQPMIPAELYVTGILPEQEINIDNIAIGVSGSGYRSDLVYKVNFESSSGIRTTGSATAIVQDGHVISLDIIERGIYTVGMGTPIVVIDPPFGYENIPLSGSNSGIGASVSFDVTSSGEISNFRFTNPGYGYTVGEVLTPIGIVTGSNYNPPKIVINEVAKDTFSAWNIGILQKLNDLTPYVNGRRKTFTIYETVNGESQPLSLETIDGSQIDLAYNLLIFVNDVLQIPGESYIFNGGTQISFTESPPAGSTLKVYFYKGSFNDTEFIDIDSPVEPGDLLQIRKDLFNTIPQQQQTRTVKRILTSDTLQTELYNKTGLSQNSSQFRSISWTPQKQDTIISGEYVSKSRYLQRSRVGLLTGIGSTDGTFVGLNTNFIQINSSVGIGSLITIGDYVESSYTGTGVTVSSIGTNIIGIGKTFYQSSSPIGTNTISLSIWRKL